MEQTTSNADRETYLLQGSDLQRSMATRSAQRQAAFFVPHLRPGMNLLDCGCGPGSITADLAELVAPGQVTGLDLDASEVERAIALAAQRGVTNVHFQTGDVYELPFADESFDAAFSNAVLDHLREPLAALREIHRVLKPGGIAGIRIADRDGYLFSPADPLIENGGSRERQLRQPWGFRYALVSKYGHSCDRWDLLAPKVQSAIIRMAQSKV